MGSDSPYDLAAPVIAYRRWRRNLKGFLISHATVWDVGKGHTAECYVCSFCGPLSEPPSESRMFDGDGRVLHYYVVPGCPHPQPKGAPRGWFACGFYGFKDAYKAYYHKPTEDYVILGKVLLGGKVYEHENGYRAEKAKLLAIYDVPEFLAGVSFRPTIVAENYNVPLLSFPGEGLVTEYEPSLRHR